MRGHDLINTVLPDELILEIFNRLDGYKPSCDAISLVCKRWLKLERASRSTIRIGASDNPDSFIKTMVQRFASLRNVYIDERLSSSSPVSYMHSIGNAMPCPIIRKGRSSKKIAGSSSKLHCVVESSRSGESDVEPLSLSDVGLVALAEGCSGLEKLSLIWCSHVTNSGLRCIAQSCKALKSLDLQGCYVGDQGLAAVGECCKQLEDLNLRFCEGLTDVGLTDLAIGCAKSLKILSVAACAKITDHSLEAVGSFCKSLHTLSLDSEFVKNKGVLSVAQGCPALKVLKLQCINVTDEALEAVGVYCLLLELLTLHSYQRFTDRSLCAIGNGCKKLNNLTLSDCYFLSDKSLEAIATGCTELKRLEINGCHNIGTSGLESIGRSCPGLSELALLYCQRIGDDAICSIAQGCRYLEKLHIQRCYEIGDKGIIAVGKNCKFLTDLSLRCCDRVSDDALIAIGQGCSLLHLNVSGCHKIGDVGLTAIARGCPQLTYLDVSVLQNLGDIALADLGEGCPRLKDIVLSRCQQITDVGLSHLVKKCTQLESCHMVYCPFVTAAGVATVVSSCAHLKRVLVEKWKFEADTSYRIRIIELRKPWIWHLTIPLYEIKCNHGEWVITVKPDLGSRIAERVWQALRTTDETVEKCRATMTEVRSALNFLLRDYGVLAIPTVPGPPPKLNTESTLLESFRARAFSLLAIAGMSGFCQVTIPLVTYNGLPVAISLIARHGQDRFLLNLVETLYGTLKEEAYIA